MVGGNGFSRRDSKKGILGSQFPKNVCWTSYCKYLQKSFPNHPQNPFPGISSLAPVSSNLFLTQMTPTFGKK